MGSVPNSSSTEPGTRQPETATMTSSSGTASAQAPSIRFMLCHSCRTRTGPDSGSFSGGGPPANRWLNQASTRRTMYGPNATLTPR